VHGDASNAIEVRNVWKVFGQGSPDEAIALAKAGSTRQDIITNIDQTVAVRDVSFSVARGETFVVMGLSGSGKSTLIRCLSRLIEPTSGEVLLNGEDLLAMNDEELREVRRGKISMVFQHFGLFPHRKVIDNIAYGLEVQKVDKATRLARATEVLNIVGLDGWADRYPQQLSGGMQQRVGLARALAVDPEILLFDEPFSALDPLIRKEMQDELIRYKNYATHHHLHHPRFRRSTTTRRSHRDYERWIFRSSGNPRRNCLKPSNSIRSRIR
jgi:glycine betaine/proline transport system ATP-binding protein